MQHPFFKISFLFKEEEEGLEFLRLVLGSYRAFLKAFFDCQILSPNVLNGPFSMDCPEDKEKIAKSTISAIHKLVQENIDSPPSKKIIAVR